MLKRILFAMLLVMGLSGTAFAAGPSTLTAVFAGGCFWSTQKAMDHMPGVVTTRAGFMGGKTKNPSYRSVTWGGSGHLEAVEVTYDPTKVSYDQLLTAFWHSTDPTNPDGVICDFGPNYHTAIFTYGTAQYNAAVASKAAVAKQLRQPVATQVIKAETVALPFYAAEAYHQHYWQTHADAYDRYYQGCGRGPALKKLWG